LFSNKSKIVFIVIIFVTAFEFMMKALLAGVRLAVTGRKIENGQ